jgi:hypothetical protein
MIPGGIVQGTAQLPNGVEQPADERLVAVRADVLNDVEHAVGNLLQRMHHAARISRSEAGNSDDRLGNALADLERLLGLLFDYVSPVDVQVRAIAAERAAESLAAQLRGQGAGEVVVEAVPGLAVLADLRALSRCFQLLIEGGGRDWSAAASVSISARHDPDGDRLTFGLHTHAELPVPASAACTLAVAVAARLLELQGGELRERVPGCVYAVVLPTANREQ